MASRSTRLGHVDHGTSDARLLEQLLDAHQQLLDFQGRDRGSIEGESTKGSLAPKAEPKVDHSRDRTRLKYNTALGGTCTYQTMSGRFLLPHVDRVL